MTRQPIVDTEIESRVAAAWSRHIDSTPEIARALVQEIARGHAVALVSHFYSVMLGQQDANQFLNNEMVEERLAASLRQWLNDVLLGGDAATLRTLMERQYHVGNVHARIGIPAHLVAAGARLIKDEIAGHIAHSTASTDVRMQAFRYAVNVIDLAIELMIAAYSNAREHSVKEDEAYRYFVGIRHVGLERERQQSTLLEWENSIVFQLATGTPLPNLPMLSTSPFGLWFKHKGAPVFTKDPQAAAVTELIRQCDEAIQRVQDDPHSDTVEARTTLLREVHGIAQQIKQLTQSMFEKMMELESGRDDLTQLLNRRFLPTVLRREIALAERGSLSFAVLMIDVDHFKSINDRHGHAAGDVVLQSVASTIVRNLRVSDYAFRYGGEEFLLVLVETDLKGASAIAERIRNEIARETIRLPGAHSEKVSVSIGLAMHTGHPDYAQLIEAADAALYRAKAEGRNRLRLAT